MKLDTERIDLGGGDSALVYKDVLRRTARLHQAEMRKYLVPVKLPGDNGKVLMSELEKLDTMPAAEYAIDLTSVDNDAINEIFILNQVVEWSFGPITTETMETAMTREQYDILVQEMDRLYKPVPLPKSAT